MRHAPTVLLLVFLGAPSTAALGALSSAELARARFLDDNGTPINVALTACAPTPTGSTCWPIAAPPTTLGTIDEVSLEGPDHGPVTLRLSTADAKHLPCIPRKALLRLPPANGARTISRYALPATELGRPVQRLDLPPDEIRIPSGKWLMSLSAAGFAPELSIVDARPGSVHRLPHQERRGWSLLLSCRDRNQKTGTGRVAVLDAEAAHERRNAIATANLTDGIAIVNGVAASVAQVEITATGYAPEAIGAITGSLGTIASRSVILRQCSGVDLTVTLDQKPVKSARCELLEPAERTERHLKLRVLAQGSTDKNGRFRKEGLAPARYILRITPSDTKTSADEALQLEEGVTDTRTLELTTITLDGTVTRASRPLEGYGIVIARKFAGAPADDDSSISTKTDEHGRYTCTLWTEGQYGIVANGPSGYPAAHRDVWISRAGKTVDMELLAAEIGGRVVDRAGKPISEAVVALRDTARFHRITQTDATGEFSYLFETAGRVTLFAEKNGYQRSEPVDVTVPEDHPAEPVTLVLGRYPALRGRLETIFGAPAPGVSVAAGDPSTGGALQGTGTVSAPDGTFEVRRAGAVTRVFATGPNCPLAVWDIPTPDDPDHEGEPVVIRCHGPGAGIALRFQDQEGKPVVREAFRLRLDGRVVPDEILARHQERFGNTIFSDPAGRLDVIALQDAFLDVYLARSSSPQTISAGLPSGHVFSDKITSGTILEAIVTQEPVTTTNTTP